MPMVAMKMLVSKSGASSKGSAVVRKISRPTVDTA